MGKTNLIVVAVAVFAAVLPGIALAAVPGAPASLPSQWLRIDQTDWTYNFGARFTDHTPGTGIWFWQTGGPSWLNLHWTGAASISGSITEGRWTVTVHAMDDVTYETATASFVLAATGPKPPPVANPISDIYLWTGDTWPDCDISSGFTDTNPLTPLWYSASGMPSWAELDSATGLFAVKDGHTAAAGEWDIAVTAWDAPYWTTAVSAFTLRVSPATPDIDLTAHYRHNGGAAFSSSVYPDAPGCRFGPDNAFDGLTGGEPELGGCAHHCWSTASQTSPGKGWAGFLFPAPVIVTKLAIKNRLSTGYAPVGFFGFAVEGSDDSTDGRDGMWETIPFASGNAAASVGTSPYIWHEFELANCRAFRFYRVAAPHARNPSNGLYYIQAADIRMDGKIEPRAPRVADGIPDTEALAGLPFEFQIPPGAFTDPDGDTLYYTNMTALPAWLAFDGLTYSGTPADGDEDLTVDVWATDNIGENPAWAADTFDIAVRTAIDTDGDGITDTEETELYGTAPDNPDTDGDGIPDGEELAFAAGDWMADPDNDGLNRLQDPDSDNNGIPDGLEDADNDGTGEWFAFKYGAQPVVTETYAYNTQNEITSSIPVLATE